MWVRLYKALQMRQKDIFAKSSADTYTKLVYSKSMMACQNLFSFFKSIKSISGMLEKDLPICGKSNTPGTSFEQGCVQIVFQFLNGFADSGLADI